MDRNEEEKKQNKPHGGFRNVMAYEDPAKIIKSDEDLVVFYLVVLLASKWGTAFDNKGNVLYFWNNKPSIRIPVNKKNQLKMPLALKAIRELNRQGKEFIFERSERSKKASFIVKEVADYNKFRFNKPENVRSPPVWIQNPQEEEEELHHSPPTNREKIIGDENFEFLCKTLQGMLENPQTPSIETSLRNYTEARNLRELGWDGMSEASITTDVTAFSDIQSVMDYHYQVPENNQAEKPALPYYGQDLPPRRGSHFIGGNEEDPWDEDMSDDEDDDDDDAASNPNYPDMSINKRNHVISPAYPKRGLSQPHLHLHSPRRNLKRECVTNVRHSGSPQRRNHPPRPIIQRIPEPRPSERRIGRHSVHQPGPHHFAPRINDDDDDDDDDDEEEEKKENSTPGNLVPVTVPENEEDYRPHPWPPLSDIEKQNRMSREFLIGPQGTWPVVIRGLPRLVSKYGEYMKYGALKNCISSTLKNKYDYDISGFQGGQQPVILCDALPSGAMCCWWYMSNHRVAKILEEVSPVRISFRGFGIHLVDMVVCSYNDRYYEILQCHFFVWIIPIRSLRWAMHL